MPETVTSPLSVIANLTVDCMCYTVSVFLQGKVICPYMKDYMTRVTFTIEWLDLVIPAIYIWKNSWHKLFIFCVICSCVCDFPSLYVLEHTISHDEYFLLFLYKWIFWSIFILNVFTVVSTVDIIFLSHCISLAILVIMQIFSDS